MCSSSADDVPFNFINGIDVDQAIGDLYFTDSSVTYPDNMRWDEKGGYWVVC